ncbi:MAG: ribonuclease Z [Gemmatimonadetes bacterium]|nr:ribonuclease Z [Gemmatimonadota bacterium]
MLAVTFLGTSAARPTVERNVSSITVAREGETLMFDCGEGTQRQMMRYGVSFTLRDIFFTHFHADHILGVTGLVRTLGLQGRTDPMCLHGPPGAKDVLGQALTLGIERVPFEIEVKEIRAGERLDRGDYDIEVFSTEHTRHSVGYAIVEHQRLGRFDPEKARALGIPEGPMWGMIHAGKSVTLEDGRTIGPEELVGPARSGRKVVLTGDTRPCESVAAAAEGADLLVHEATFAQEEEDRARETGHSTAREAAQVALAARVRKLALCHLSARYSRDFGPVLEEARAVFPEVVVAKDGMTIDVPFADAGSEG